MVAGCGARDAGGAHAPPAQSPHQTVRASLPPPSYPATAPSRHHHALRPAPMLAIPNCHLPATHRPRDPESDTGCRLTRSRGVVALGQRVGGWLGSAGLGLAATRDRPHPQDRRPGPSRPPDTGRIRPDPTATMPSRAGCPSVQECWAWWPTHPEPLHCSQHRLPHPPSRWLKNMPVGRVSARGRPRARVRPAAARHRLPWRAPARPAPRARRAHHTASVSPPASVLHPTWSAAD